jgi:MoaA/NifB/PqqE/SkfB family radical SAM enzyme
MDTHAWDTLDAADKQKILKGIARGKALAPPRVVDLEWSRREWLPDATRDRRPGLPPDEMDLYTLEMLFEEMENAGVKALVLGGEGEPLAHRSIESLLKRISRAPFRLCSLATGGGRLCGRTAELLAAARPRRLDVRLEALGEAAYALRLGAPGSQFRQVAANLRAFRALLPAQSDCRIVARLVLFPGDNAGLQRIVRAAVEAGADAVAVAAPRQPGIALDNAERRAAFLDEVRTALAADREGRIESLEAPHPAMEADLRSLRADLSAGGAPGTASEGAVGALFRTACIHPWLGLALAPNGAVHPCRRALQRGGDPTGSIHSRPLERLWHDRPLRVMRWASRRSCWDGRACSICRAGEAPSRPYALDWGFCQELDSLLRGGVERAVRFPERLRDREWGTVLLPLRHLWPRRWGGTPQLRVDGVPVGAAVGGGGGIAIRFLPDGLRPGFHLVEVVDRSGRLLKARLVEKVQ